MPGKAPSAGTKVSDPHSTIQESSGPITTDSLAAQSQTFQTSNRNATPLSVSGPNSTFTTTNTSGATKLPPTNNASSRTTQESYTSQDKNAAVEGTYHGQSSHNSVEAQKAYAGTAPTYVNTVLESADLHDAKKPKGKHLKEVEDFGNVKNASFESDIGDGRDPGREAERKFEVRSGGNLVAAGVPSRGVKEGGEYDVLKSEERV